MSLRNFAMKFGVSDLIDSRIADCPIEIWSSRPLDVNDYDNAVDLGGLIVRNIGNKKFLTIGADNYTRRANDLVQKWSESHGIRSIELNRYCLNPVWRNIRDLDIGDRETIMKRYKEYQMYNPQWVQYTEEDLVKNGKVYIARLLEWNVFVRVSSDSQANEHWEKSSLEAHSASPARIEAPH